MTQAGSGSGSAARCDANGHGVIIFTDGGCRGNPGIGAWAAVILSEGNRQEICGVEPRTTNNRMELTAALEALRTLEPGCAVTLMTDSNYLRRGITEWMPRWIARGWKTADKKPVLNRDLWEQLNDVDGQHDIEWRWVRGHSGDPENERCDELLNQAMDEHQSGGPSGGSSIAVALRAERPRVSGSGRNVEIKAHVIDLQALKEKVMAIADGPPQVLQQMDTFYNVPRGRLKLRQQDQGANEIIFYERPDGPAPKQSSYSIARVDDPQALDLVLAAALGVHGIVRKRRTLFLVGQTRVHLDQVDGLGDFVELEVVLGDDQGAGEGRDVAETLMANLGIVESALVEGAYVDLL